jgi:hypothetical protein
LEGRSEKCKFFQQNLKYLLDMAALPVQEETIPVSFQRQKSPSGKLFWENYTAAGRLGPGSHD